MKFGGGENGDQVSKGDEWACDHEDQESLLEHSEAIGEREDQRHFD